MPEWTQRRYSKGEIDRAGAWLVPWWKDPNAPYSQEVTEAYAVVENWRTSHAMPLLTFRMALQNRAKRVDPKAIVAQRLKRFSSVMNKLVREPVMKLSQMQDLGGCRAIVSNVENVYRLYNLYQEHQQDALFRSEGSLKSDDYISSPKPDGYRGIHVIGRYRSQNEKNAPWNGQRIEIQLRSRLQHLFATTVETVTTFTRQPLKFGAGPEEWQRFFSLTGSIFAVRENAPRVPGTPANEHDTARELGELTISLNVHQRLKGWTDAVKRQPWQYSKGSTWLLLVLNIATSEVRVTGFTSRTRASKALARIEKQVRGKELDAVLVWVGSLNNLRRAYPNYYADTREFLDALKIALESVDVLGEDARER